jgi:dTDP-4-dehydrorhamnose 3,5-epimerase
MIKIETKIQRAYIIKPVFHEDSRGTFYTSFSRDAYNEIGIFNMNVAQINHSISMKGVLRGLHYQADLDAQAKLIWLSHGSCVDIFVDLRTDSPTYGKWDKVFLKADGNRVYIPKGCAHGFYSLEDGTEFNYICSNPWNKEAERTLLWNDPDLQIDWSLQYLPIISPKDQQGKSFKECDKYYEY